MEIFKWKIESRSEKLIELNQNGMRIKYSILALLPFSSHRKRMSIIVRDLESNSIFLLTKVYINLNLRVPII